MEETNFPSLIGIFFQANLNAVKEGSTGSNFGLVAISSLHGMDPRRLIHVCTPYFCVPSTLTTGAGNRADALTGK